MTELRVKRARPIATELRVPGDKSISHCAVLISALSNGPCRIAGFLPSPGCLATVNACRALGVKIEELADDDDEAPREADAPGNPQGPTRLLVHGRSMTLARPVAPLDCSASGTALCFLTGILAGQPFLSNLTAAPSAPRHAFQYLLAPLHSMGATIARSGDGIPTISIGGRKSLKPVTANLEIPSAVAKGTLILAALFAGGKSTITVPQTTRDHVERMLQTFQVRTLRHGTSVTVHGGQVPESCDVQIPGDFSSAAPWITTAAAQPGSDLVIRGVGLNPARTGLIKVLVRMGALICEDLMPATLDEPQGHVIVRGAPLRGTVIDGREIVDANDELPLLAVAGALASGRTVIRDAQELRARDIDRLAAIAQNLRLMGVSVRELYDGLEIKGTGLATPLNAAALNGYHDARISMAFAVAGLFAEGETVIEDAGTLESEYPNFSHDLHLFQTKLISSGILTPVITSLPSRPPEKSLPAAAPARASARPS